MSKYQVQLDIVFLEYHEVEADTEAEAVEIAERESDYKGSIAGVFGVEELDV